MCVFTSIFTALGTALGAIGGAVGGGALGYLGTRAGGKILNNYSKERKEKILDRALVANGDMSEEEYIKKHVK